MSRFFGPKKWHLAELDLPLQLKLHLDKSAIICTLIRICITNARQEGQTKYQR